MHFLKKPIVFILFLFCVITFNPSIVIAQAPGYEWVKQAGGSDFESVNDIEVDDFGNSYITGRFHGSATFGNFTLNCLGDQDLFIVKYDSTGNVVWAKQGRADMTAEVQNISVNGDGSFYITGHFNGTIQLGNTYLTTTLWRNTFYAKYDTFGGLIWAKKIDGTGFSRGWEIIPDNAGNTFLTGRFAGNIIADTFSLTSVTAYQDIYLAKIDSLGNVIWAKREGGIRDEHSSGIALDNDGNIYIVGSFTGNTVFGNITLINASSGSNSTDMLIVKFDSFGNVVWAKRGGGQSDFEAAHSIAFDEFNNCYVTGGYTGNGYFNSTPIFGSATSSNMFLAKYDTAGNLIWFRNSQPPTGYSWGSSLDLDNFGNVFITGRFQQSVNFSGSILSGNGLHDIFIAKYNPQGDLIWAKSSGGSRYDAGQAIAIDQNGVCYITGTFQDTVSFGNTTLSSSAFNDYDIFIAKLKLPLITIEPDSISLTKLCPGDEITVPFAVSEILNNGNVFTAQLSDAFGSLSLPIILGSISGISSDTIIAAIPNNIQPGSDYRIRIISSSPVLISADNGTDISIGTAPIPGFVYQLNSNSISLTDTSSGGSSLVYNFGDSTANSLAQNPTHIFDSLGTYIITQTVISAEGCSASTSQTVSIITTGLPSSPTSTLSTFPNPFSNSFQISLTGTAPATATLTDMLGRQVHRQVISTKSGRESATVTPSANLPSGMYILQTQQGEIIQQTRILKQ